MIRVVKYAKNWKRLSSASIKGEEVYKVFEGGRVQVQTYGGQIYLRTAVERYADKSGTHHQTNLSIQIAEDNMKVTEYCHTAYDQYGNSYTYQCSDWDVSHSFNQFLIIDDKQKIVTLDHGDAYPRAAVVHVYDDRAGTEQFAMKSVAFESADMMRFGGKSGENLTRASLGGLSYSDDCYFAVGTSIDQNTSDWRNIAIRNAFISVIPKNNFKAGTKITWLTDYEEGDNYSASNPYIVRIDGDTLWIAWEEMQGHSEYHNPYPDKKLRFVFVDGKGKLKSKVYEAEGYLSDCQPIFANDKIVWYATSREGIWFSTIDLNGKYSKHVVVGLAGDPAVQATVLPNGSVSLKWNRITGSDGYYILRRIVKADSWNVKVIDISDPNVTDYVDSINFYTNGDLCEYFVHAYDDKVWSKGTAQYIALTGIDKNRFIQDNSPVNGKKYTVDGLVYKYNKKEVTLVGIKQKTAILVIPDEVSVLGKTYPVTAIASGVCQKDSVLKQIVIGKNVKSVGNNAFRDCRWLWRITANSKKMKLGKKAFSKPGGSFAKTVYVNLPKKKYAAYKKMLQKNGIKSPNVKVKYNVTV